MRTMHMLLPSVRAFNRFYTKQIGLLRKGYLDSPFSLSEVRVLYELVHRKNPIASEISKELESGCRVPEPAARKV